MKNTLIILGSSRGDGNTRQVVDYLQQYISADFIDLNEYNFSPYDYQHQNADDDFLGLAKRMIEYQNIVFATPVYWYAMSAVMKKYFDRLSDITGFRKEVGRKLKGKNLFALACSSDEEEHVGFFMPFEKTAGYLDMNFGGSVHTWVEENGLSAEVKKRVKDFSNNVNAE